MRNNPVGFFSIRYIFEVICARALALAVQKLSQRFNVNTLQQLCNENRPYHEKIRWSIIRFESELEQELK
jgi:hypothetical protein